MPERRHEHECFDLHPTDLDQILPEVDLQPSAGGISSRVVASASAFSACTAAAITRGPLSSLPQLVPAEERANERGTTDRSA